MTFNRLKKLVSFTTTISCLTAFLTLMPCAAITALAEQTPALSTSPMSPSKQTDDQAKRLESLLQEILVLRAAIAGQALEGGRLERILSIDYCDQASVDGKKAGLQGLVTEKRKELQKANWSGRPPFPDLQPQDYVGPSGLRAISVPEPTRFHTLLAEYESLRLQLRFLSLSASDRAAFHEREAEADRMAQEKIKEEEQKRLAEKEADRMAEARRAAEERTETARKETDRAIAGERTALEAIGSELAAYLNNIAFNQEQLSLTEQERRALLVVLRNKANTAPAESPAMDALYDEMVQIMQTARRDLASSLDSYAALPPAPSYRGDLSSLTPIVEDQKTAIEELKELSKQTASRARKAETLAGDLAWSRLKATIAWSEDVSTLRLDVLQKVSRPKRALLLGITREGIAQLKREITDIALFLRWTKAGGKKFLIEEVSSLKDPFVAGGFASKVLWIILLLAVYGYVIRHGKGFLERLQGLANDVLRSPLLLRRTRQVFSLVQDMFRELVLLGAVISSPVIIGFDPARKYWHVAYAIALWYAAYRLLVRISLHTINWLMPGDQLDIQLGQNRLLLRSVVLAGRYILMINVILIIAEAILGQGYLYHIVTSIAWIGAFIIFAILIRWWREGISQAYLKIKPSGTLAGFVQATRSRWYGFFVAIAAFGVLMADTLAHAFQRFIYSFEQSQRMLAYLFRRRLEKNALLTEGDAPPPLGLPPEAAAFFNEGPLREPSLLIDFFPHMDLFTKAVQEWKTGSHVGAFAIVGDFGFGKTTWLIEARQRTGDGNTAFLAITERATTQNEVLTFLASGLGAPAEAGKSTETLSTWLRRGEKRLVIVDDLHLWFLRSIGASEALRAFNTIAQLTGDHIFWLCSLSNYPYRYYSWASGDNTVFRAVVTLPPWPEKTIETLLRTRSDLAGLRLNFDGLLMESAENYQAKTDPAATAKDYNRLIWDLSLGSPRAAIQYWVTSLSVDAGGVARVRFFNRPDGKVLDDLNEQDRFVLACVVWHEQASIAEISSMLRFPSGTCTDAIWRLRELGVLHGRGDYFRVTAQWWPETVRYLKRKHLVPSES